MSVLLNETTRPIRPHYAILAFAWAAWFFGFASLMLLTMLLVPIKTDLRLTEPELAWLTGVGIGFTGVGGLVFGWLSDVVGRRASIVIAVVAFVGGNAACAFASDVAMLQAARALAGFGIGGTWGAGQALLSETVPAAIRDRFGALAQTGAPLGFALAAVLGHFVEPDVGWRNVFLMATVPLVILVLLPAVPESDVWRQRDRMAPLPPETARLFVKCLLLTSFSMSSYWLIASWLPKYLREQRGMNEAQSGSAILVLVTGTLTGYLLFGIAAATVGRRIAFSIFSLLTAVGLVMFTIFWARIETTPSVILVCMFVTGVGMGTWSSFGPMFSELFATRIRGIAMSSIMNVTRSVQFVAPLLIVAVAPRWGMDGGIALGALFSVLAGAWIWTLPETRGSKLKL